MIYPDSCLNKIGLFQKKSTPPHPPGFPKLLEPPSPKDFQVQRPPTHMDLHKIFRHCDFT